MTDTLAFIDRDFRGLPCVYDFLPNLDSVPLSRRPMFEWWRHTASPPISEEKANNTQKSDPVLPVAKNITHGKATAAAIEARETYRAEKNTSTHMRATAR